MTTLVPAPALALGVGPLVAESVDSNGQPVLGFCGSTRLSVTGRHLVFACNQPELLQNEPNVPQSGPATHAFARDRLTGRIEIADVDDQGRYYAQSARYGLVSADGRYVVFESRAPLIPEFDWPAISPGRSYVYLRDTLGGTTELIARMADGSIPEYAMWQSGLPDFERGEVLLSGQTDLLTGEFTPYGGSLFVRNWRTGAVERVTVAMSGAPSHGGPGVLSADGRYVVFTSSADDLTDDNPRGLPNLFIRDRQARTTRRLSFPAGGGEFETPLSTDGSLQLTADGRYLVFTSSNRELVEDGEALPYSNVYLMDLTDGSVRLASTGSRGQRPDGASASGRISADGRYLAFATRATNLLDTPQRPGVYVKDRLTGALVDASASLGEMPESGLPDLDLSADGSTLAFTWIDSAYPQGDPRRQQMYSATLRGDPVPADPIAVPSTARPAWLVLAGLLTWIGAVAIRRDGRSPRSRGSGASRRSAALLGLAVMTAASDTSALEVGAPVLESYGSDGQIVMGFCWTGGVSPNGRYLIVTCNHAGLREGPGEEPLSDPPRHAYLRDRHTGRVDMLDLDDQGQYHPYHGWGLKASHDGRYVVFVSNAPLTPETDWTIFDFGRAFAYLRDVHEATTHLIARRADGAAPELSTSALDANFLTNEVLLKGRTDLIGGGTTSGENLYVRNWVTGAIELISITLDGRPIEGYLWEATASTDGRFVAFVSAASELTDDNPAGFVNIFLRDRRMQHTRRLTFPAGGGEFSTHIQPYDLQLTRDNRYLVFTAHGQELVVGGGDLPMRNAYLMDLSDGSVELASIGAQGQHPDSYTEQVRISADGRYLAFATRATNLLDTPQPAGGVYVKDRWTGRMINATATLNGGPDYYPPSFDLSEDGSTLVVNWTDTTFIQGDPRRLRMYSIALRGDAPAPSPQSVPALSDAFRLILLAAFAAAGWTAIGRRGRARSRMPRD